MLVGRPIRIDRITRAIGPMDVTAIAIVKCVKGEEEILGVIAASITPTSMVDEALIQISPKKEPRRKIQTPIPVIQANEELYVVSCDGSARVKRGGGAYSAILWKLPEWTVIQARSAYAEDLTVNEAEYHALLLCLDLLSTVDRKRVVFCGDSNLVIRQVRAQITAVVTRPGSRSTTRTASDPRSLREEVVRGLRIDPIRQAQDEEAWISGLKKYLNGDLHLTQQEAKSYANLAADYDLDHHDLLFYCSSTRSMDADRDKLMRLVIPETLYQDILHYYHVSLEGGHQGISRTYQRIRDHFHWRGLYKSVQRYVGECVDCETGKSKPRIQGESPGNLQATYPFQIIAMDHIPSLPRSHKGNTELLIFEDIHWTCDRESQLIKDCSDCRRIIRGMCLPTI
ncbi:Reverse transcriptase [Phytophthora palmivora]|uniref:Reverse transcriptase n=1 Tax=Phytophthora palmivora TaxID=4796 RepID=A0A2P4XV97_9STRA|nr:Reverse transcriptase [Phytophthora palmivora]